MIYIKVHEKNVILAGQVANQTMIEEGYVQYEGEIPQLGEFQHFEFVEALYDGEVLVSPAEIVAVNDEDKLDKEILKDIDVGEDDEIFSNKCIRMIRGYNKRTGKTTNEIVTMVTELVTIREFLQLGMPGFAKPFIEQISNPLYLELRDRLLRFYQMKGR